MLASWRALAMVMVAVTGCCRTPQPNAAVTSRSVQPTRAAKFVGMAACVECHEKQVTEWTGSHHDLAMQEATDATVLGDFQNVTHTYHSVTTTFFRKDGKFMVRTDGPDGDLHDYDVAYTFGNHPLQQYLIKFPDGRMQALNVCWDTRGAKQGGQRWFHLYPNEEIRHDDILHWTGPHQNWNHMCAECHSTDVHKNYDAAKDEFHTTWSQIDVSCEACHGPGSEHVAWARAHTTEPRGTSQGAMGLVVRLKEFPPPRTHLDTARGILMRDHPRTDHAVLETCARCHSRRGTFSEDYVPGQPLAQTHRLALLESELYEADGQIHDEVYEYGSFLQSKMHAAGVTCTDCHNPHTLKTAGGNQTCAACHVPAKYDTPAHHKHTAGTAAAACVSCHAPTRNYMVIHARHDHSFRVPRPDLTVVTGAPNACNGCHADQTPQWAAQAAAAWWPSQESRSPHFGEIFAAARRQEPGSASSLIRLLDDSLQPAIVRASAAEWLESNPSPDMVPALKRALGNSDPLVRAAAARSLRSGFALSTERREMLMPLLQDPVRQVRMDAATAILDGTTKTFTAEQKASLQRALSEYQSAEQYGADRAESRLNLGVLALSQGNLQHAEEEYLAAIRLSPRFPAGYVNLADLYRSQGRERDAARTMQDGLKLAPKDAGLRHALGLALVRQERLPDALSELALAHKFAPDSARYAYVYAVALESSGQRKEAIKVLRAAQARHVGDPDILMALAMYCYGEGQLAEATSYAELLFTARPWDPEAQATLAQLRQAQ